ncbi:MAG: hypothetical protein NT123_24580, partial [Proteobacteria bacterium]|nr:hypothetical protein [Pseudomonadota bacterium]
VAKTGTTNVYLINAEIVWTASATSRRKAEFRANVVLAESEQMRPTDEPREDNERVQVASKKRIAVRSRRIAEA